MNQQESSRFEVFLEERSYPLEIGHDLKAIILQKSDELIETGTKVVAVVDDGMRKANPEFLREIYNSIPHLSLPSGEKTKSSNHLIQIWDFLASQKLDRSSSLFAIGGGVIGDLAGFAAASFMRGISLYQVPTTLLSMVDSSVGGKTGINLKAGKNLVGSFHQPKGVFMDLKVLSTLSSREFAAGMAEVIKYGMIGNRTLYEKLVSQTKPLSYDSPSLLKLIRTCCIEKARLVQADEREMASDGGGRALLNLGHTFAHAIEAVAGYGDYLHGEAVSIGLLCALRLSKSQGFCMEDPESMLVDILSSYGLPTALKHSLSISTLMEKMLSDKKVSHGKLRFVMMKEIGDAFVEEISEACKIEEVWASVGAA